MTFLPFQLFQKEFSLFMSYFFPQPFDAAVNDVITETPPPEVFAQSAAELFIIGRCRSREAFFAPAS